LGLADIVAVDCAGGEVRTAFADGVGLAVAPAAGSVRLEELQALIPKMTKTKLTTMISSFIRNN